MSDIARYKLDNESGDIFIEYIEPDSDSYYQISRGEKQGDKETSRFSEALKKIKPAAELLMSQFRSLSVQPDEIELEFGIKFSGSLGAIIASTQTDANFNVTMKWKNREAGASADSSGSST